MPQRPPGFSESKGASVTKIGPYLCETSFKTFGSGSAQWCFATLDSKRFFIKRFLSPVCPTISPDGQSALQQARMARCEAFLQHKQTVYDALSCVLGDWVVPVTDFFIHDNHFIAVSEAIDPASQTFETLGHQPPTHARELLYALACCLARLHAQSLVHGDLKPEHILLQRQNDQDRVRLIDFDSSFLAGDNSVEAGQAEGDPLYLAPETFQRMAGGSQRLTYKVDTFAYGLIAHQLLSGNLPDFDHARFHFPCEAVLSGNLLRLSNSLPTAYRWMIRKALSPNPDSRPEDSLLQRFLAPPGLRYIPSGLPVNSLSRYWKTGS